jgi:hypothetical protein
MLAIYTAGMDARRRRPRIAGAAALAAVVACLLAATGGTTPTSSAIEDVWADVGCDTPSAGASFAASSETLPPIIRQASCEPFGGDAVARFFELESEEQAAAWAADSDAVLPPGGTFVAGPVVVWTSDSDVASDLNRLYRFVD